MTEANAARRARRGYRMARHAAMYCADRLDFRSADLIAEQWYYRTTPLPGRQILHCWRAFVWGGTPAPARNRGAP